MSILNGKIADAGATTGARSAVGTRIIGGNCTESTIGDIRRFGRNDDKPPTGTVTASVPSAEEGLRLIQAFRQITDPHQRKRIIEEAEAIAKRP